MKPVLLCKSFIFVSLFICHTALAASISPALSKAKSDAASRDYVFATSHDEIVAGAKKEGRLRVLSGLDPEVLKTIISAFRKKYPFIDISGEEAAGIDQHQRIILELKAGTNKEWDVISMANELYADYVPYQKKVDILGMAEQGILQIHPKMIDPKNRNIAALTAMLQVGVAFNKNLISIDRTPNTWEDYLKPEFKGKKFLADIRPTEIASLVPAWGLEKTLDYAKKLAAQEPVWVRGGTRGLTSVTAGETPMFIGNNYKTIRRAQQKDRTGVLGYKFLDPVPVRLSESLGVLATSSSPNTALLWIEFQASAEGQRIIDELEPFGASIYGPGTVQSQEIKGRNLSLVDWDHYIRLGDYQEKVVEAYGFPRAMIKSKKK